MKWRGLLLPGALSETALV